MDSIIKRIFRIPANLISGGEDADIRHVIKEPLRGVAQTPFKEKDARILRGGRSGAQSCTIPSKEVHALGACVSIDGNHRQRNHVSEFS